MISTPDQLLLLLPQAFGATGGVQRFCRYLIAACNHKDTPGAHLASIALLDAPQAVEAASLEGVQYTACGGSRIKMVWSLILALRSQPSIVILAHLNFSPLVFLIHALSPGSKTISVLHGFEAWEKLPWFKMAGLRRCTFLISVSHYTRAHFCESNHFESNRVQVVHLPIDPLWNPGIPVKGPLESLPFPYLLSVSRLEPGHSSYKGLDLTIQALGMLHNQGLLAPYRWLIAGEGADRPRLETLAAAHGLGEMVVFLGRVSEPELQSLYAGCELFVLPSQKEGFGLVFLEAMAFARPVVAAHAGAVDEVVVDGETGLLIPPGNAEALGSAIARLISEPGTRQKLGKAGQRRVMEHFLFPQFVQRLGEVLDAVMDSTLPGIEHA